jgi:hypothetical protein
LALRGTRPSPFFGSLLGQILGSPWLDNRMLLATVRPSPSDSPVARWKGPHRQLSARQIIHTSTIV